MAQVHAAAERVRRCRAATPPTPRRRQFVAELSNLVDTDAPVGGDDQRWSRRSAYACDFAAEGFRGAATTSGSRRDPRRDRHRKRGAKRQRLAVSTSRATTISSSRSSTTPSALATGNGFTPVIPPVPGWSPRPWRAPASSARLPRTSTASKAGRHKIRRLSGRGAAGAYHPRDPRRRQRLRVSTSATRRATAARRLRQPRHRVVLPRAHGSDKVEMFFHCTPTTPSRSTGVCWAKRRQFFGSLDPLPRHRRRVGRPRPSAARKFGIEAWCQLGALPRGDVDLELHRQALPADPDARR